MIDKLSLYLTYPFVRYALIVGILIALCSSLLGVTLVLKRFSFIGDGLSHVAFGAMAIAAVLNLTDEMIDKYQILELDEKQTVLGHECTGYNMIQDLQGQQAQVTSWVWNGIPLKSELKMGEITQTIEVLELEEVSEVPAKYVTIPEDAKITEM